MRFKLLAEEPKTYAVIFETGDELRGCGPRAR